MEELNEKTVGIRDIQDEELKILLDFVRICEQNNLTYYISGGTFIGAVRHNGFIPWDDDIDVAMPRKDYNKFLELAQNQLESKFKLVHFNKCENVIHYFAKIENSKYQLIDHTAAINRKVNLWIDIFPLDGLPKNSIARKIHSFRLMSLRALFKFSLFETIVYQSNTDRPWYERVLIEVGKRIKFEKILNPYNRMRALDRALSRYDFYTSKYIMNFMGSYKLKSVMDRELVYGEGAYYNFEGHLFHAPKDYDRYLTQIYGDYMKLPPLEKRNQHQTTIVSLTNDDTTGE